MFGTDLHDTVAEASTGTIDGHMVDTVLRVRELKTNREGYVPARSYRWGLGLVAESSLKSGPTHEVLEVWRVFGDSGYQKQMK